MNDDREFIDLDSTQNWSQLDVKRELDNLEVDAETGKKYDFARGFSGDNKQEEDKILLDGLTSGLNYIPEEFLMAADEKKEQEIEKKPEEERPDVSWAYRNADEKVDDEPFVPLADIKKAEKTVVKKAEEPVVKKTEESVVKKVEEPAAKKVEEATVKKAEGTVSKRAEEAVSKFEETALKKAEEEDAHKRTTEVTVAKDEDPEIEAIRRKNLEEQARRIAEANASDELVRANIEARKRAREELAAQNEARIKEEAEARKAAQKQAEIDMYKDQIFDLDDLDVPVVTKEERIAAANKNRRVDMDEYDAIEVAHPNKRNAEESEDVAKEIEEVAASKAEEVQTVAAFDEEDKATDKASLESSDDDIMEVVYELDEVEKAQVESDFEQDKKLSTGDTGVIYLDDDGEEINETIEETVRKNTKAASATDEYLAWADSDDEEPVRPKKKKKKKKKKKPVYHEVDVEEVEEENYEEEDEEGGFYLSFWDRVVKFFKNMSGLDVLVIATGVLVVVVAAVTIGVYSSSKATQAKLDELAGVGQKMQTIGITGSDKLVAVADARRAVAEIVEEPIEEEEAPVEYNEKEEDNSISVVMSLTSVKKDLKIKFTNAKSKKLVGNHVFKVAIEDSKGKKYNATDDDKDGIIYINSIEPGKAKVTMLDMPDSKDITYSREALTVTIKENIDYKKIDVADEVKTESEINAKAEDTAIGQKVEGVLTDTVEWVESTKVASEDGYTKVELSSIPNPAKITAGATKTASNNVKIIGDRVAASRTELPAPYTLYRPMSELPEDPDPTDPADPDSPDADATATAAAAEATAAAGEANNQATATAAAEATATAAAADAEATAAAGESQNQANATAAAATATAGAAATEAVVAPTLTAGAANAQASATAGAAKISAEASSPKNDTTTPLKDKSGNQLYIKNADGTYTEAKYADYFVVKEFYRKGGEYKYTGWQVIDGETYFFDKNGVKVTGEQVIQGAKYNFASNGALVKGSGTMGIDVSKWNGNINWTAVKNSGVSFVIIRCGYRGSSSGALVEDPKFRANIKGATDAGLKVGVYFFSQAVTDVEAVEEASMAISLMKGYKVSYPVFLDVEDSGGRGDRIDANTRTNVIKAFCETLRNSGYTAGVYANKSWLQTKMNVGSLSSYKIWLAQYNTQPTYTGRYDMWQYSSKGTVGGIGGNTDMNLSYLGY